MRDDIDCTRKILEKKKRKVREPFPLQRVDFQVLTWFEELLDTEIESGRGATRSDPINVHGINDLAQGAELSSHGNKKGPSLDRKAVNLAKER